MLSITEFYFEACMDGSPHVSGKEGSREARRETTSCCCPVIYSQELLRTVKENTKQGPLGHDQCDVDASEWLIHPLWPALPISGVTAKGHSVSVLKGC